ncbi:hypothetical protein ACRAWD_20315 [Caulobacter segnis]
MQRDLRRRPGGGRQLRRRLPRLRETRAAEVIDAAEAHPDSGLPNAYAATSSGCCWKRPRPPSARLLSAWLRAEAAAGEAHPRERAFQSTSSPLGRPTTFPAALGHRRGEPGEGLAARPAGAEASALSRLQPRRLPRLPCCAPPSPPNPMPATSPGLHGHAGLRLASSATCRTRPKPPPAAPRTSSARSPGPSTPRAQRMRTQGRIDQGVAFLESVRDSWTGLNSFMDTHLWWHLPCSI